MYQFTGQGQDLLGQARQLHTDSNDQRYKRNLERAALLLEQALKLRRTALISPHAILTATVDSLAHLYQEMGEHHKWREYAKMAVEEKVAMLGELHVETQSSLDNLNDACVACYDFEGAAAARERCWNSKTSTLGVKEATMPADGLIGDIDRMLEYWRKQVPSIRRTSADDADLETRLKTQDGSAVQQGGTGLDRQAAVAAAQAATNALMNCDFNDRRPVKRDPELEQLLVDHMSKADYLRQFNKPPEARWIKDNQVWLDKSGNPATPPTENPLKAPEDGKAGAGGGRIDPKSGASQSGASESGAAPTDSLAGGAPEEEEEEDPDAALPPDDEEADAPPEDGEEEVDGGEEDEAEAPPEE